MIEAVEAGQWARDLAYYLRRHPCALELRIRVKNLTKGHGLTEDDLDQLTRKTRWLLFGAPRVRENRKQARLKASLELAAEVGKAAALKKMAHHPPPK